MQTKDARYKASRIKKLASQIRSEAAAGHLNTCQCPVCQATFLVQRSMVFLEGAWEAESKDATLQKKAA